MHSMTYFTDFIRRERTADRLFGRQIECNYLLAQQRLQLADGYGWPWSSGTVTLDKFGCRPYCSQHLAFFRLIRFDRFNAQELSSLVTNDSRFRKPGYVTKRTPKVAPIALMQAFGARSPIPRLREHFHQSTSNIFAMAGSVGPVLRMPHLKKLCTTQHKMAAIIEPNKKRRPVCLSEVG
jgi:hypothetical protein